jgi:hypothetical protein
MKTDNVADRLDELFNRLDEAMLSPEIILTSEVQRELRVNRYVCLSSPCRLRRIRRFQPDYLGPVAAG